jgi:hypothetical protein
MNITTIIAIASGQVDPIILPFVTEEIDCKHLVLLASPKIKADNTHTNIQAALSPKGVKTTVIDVPDDLTTPENWEAFQQILEQIIAMPNVDQATTVFNANGGTKPMTLAAYEWFYNNDIPVFYIEKDQLNWLYDPTKSLSPISIAQGVDKNTFFGARGIQLKPTEQLTITREIKKLIDHWVTRDQQKEIGEINYLASKAQKNDKLKVKINDSDGFKISENAKIMLEELEDIGLLKYKKDTVEFTSNKAVQFVNGGWYEHYVQHLLQDINKHKFNGKGDVILGHELYLNNPNSKTNVKNELDVIFLLKNQLFVFECKTVNYKNTEARIDDALYKLIAVLKSTHTLMSKGAIMSYRKIKQVDKERAEKLGVNVITHLRDEKSLKNNIVKFIEGIELQTK